MEPGTPFTLQFFKHPDTVHWRLDTEFLGRDAYGLWLSSPAGTTAQKGSDPVRTIRHAGVHLVPDDWWVLSFHPGSPTATHYLDVATPPTIGDDRVTMVDLDLDVLRLADGRVVLEDEDEFAEHQVRLSYPPAWVDAARDAASWGVEALTAGNEPFITVAQRWWDVAHRP